MAVLLQYHGGSAIRRNNESFGWKRRWLQDRRAFGSHGNVHVLLENTKFYHNFAWRMVGQSLLAVGKRPRNNQASLGDHKSHFDLNQAFQGSGEGKSHKRR